MRAPGVQCLPVWMVTTTPLLMLGERRKARSWGGVRRRCSYGDRSMKFRSSCACDSLGMVDHSRNAGEDADLPAVSIEEMAGGLTWPEFVAELHPTWPGAVLDLDNGAVLQMLRDDLDHGGRDA